MTFREHVYDLIQQIPSGKVATYGQIASLMGNARASRQVGFALRALTLDETTIPWWRVVNRVGYISINHSKGGAEKQLQADLLKDEGVEISEEYIIDLPQYLWTFTRDTDTPVLE